MVARAPRVIGARRARAKLAELLREVQAGRDWLITDYGRPVAKLVSVLAGDLNQERRLRQLEEAGVIERPRSEIRLPVPITLRGRIPAPTASRRRPTASADGMGTERSAGGTRPVFYWDGPVILSALLRDRNSEAALALLRTPGVHIASTLARFQVFAVTARLCRQGRLTKRGEMAIAWALGAAPWRTTHACPSSYELGLARPEWGLGAIELWHLATARALAGPLPELQLLTFDARLRAAATSMRLPVAGSAGERAPI